MDSIRCEPWVDGPGGAGVGVADVDGAWCHIELVAWKLCFFLFLDAICNEKNPSIY